MNTSSRCLVLWLAVFSLTGCGQGYQSGIGLDFRPTTVIANALRGTFTYHHPRCPQLSIDIPGDAAFHDPLYLWLNTDFPDKRDMPSEPRPQGYVKAIKDHCATWGRKLSWAHEDKHYHPPEVECWAWNELEEIRRDRPLPPELVHPWPDAAARELWDAASPEERKALRAETTAFFEAWYASLAADAAKNPSWIRDAYTLWVITPYVPENTRRVPGYVDDKSWLTRYDLRHAGFNLVRRRYSEALQFHLALAKNALSARDHAAFRNELVDAAAVALVPLNERREEALENLARYFTPDEVARTVAVADSPWARKAAESTPDTKPTPFREWEESLYNSINRECIDSPRLAADLARIKEYGSVRGKRLHLTVYRSWYHRIYSVYHFLLRSQAAGNECRGKSAAILWDQAFTPGLKEYIRQELPSDFGELAAALTLRALIRDEAFNPEDFLAVLDPAMRSEAQTAKRNATVSTLSRLAALEELGIPLAADRRKLLEAHASHEERREALDPHAVRTEKAFALAQVKAHALERDLSKEQAATVTGLSKGFSAEEMHRIEETARELLARSGVRTEPHRRRFHGCQLYLRRLLLAEGL